MTHANKALYMTGIPLRSITSAPVSLIVTPPHGPKASCHVNRQKELAMKVNVSTSNSLKVEAVRAVFAAAFPEDDIEVNAISVPSGVSAQRVMSIHRLMPITLLPRLSLDIASMDS